MPEYVEEDRADCTVRTIRTERLELRFEWATDRWQHLILLRAGDEWRRVAVTPTRIGDPGDHADRVLDPPYQQFHYQAGKGRGVALLVGQSGRHHLSASFEVNESPAVTRIVVDVADRVRAEKPSLACCYHVLHRPSAAMTDGPARVVWSFAGFGRLTLSSGSSGDDSSRIVVRALYPVDEIPCTHVTIAEDAVPASPTLRCRYQWTLDAVNEPGTPTM